MSKLKHYPFSLFNLDPAAIRGQMSIEPARVLEVDGVEGAVEVQVGLPVSYSLLTDKDYPVIYVTDGNMRFASVVGIVQDLVLGLELPEMIVVGIGAPRTAPLTEFSRHRTHSLTFHSELLYCDDFFGRYLESIRPSKDALADSVLGGGPAFLDFIVDRLAPMMNETYRIDPAEQCLYGYSAGGSFTGWAMFKRPGAFARYLCGSPCLTHGGNETFELEAAYAADHEDLAVAAFFSAGEGELQDPFFAAADVVGSMARMVQTLRVRAYPSMKVYSRIFPEQGHASVPAQFTLVGLKTLWEQEMAKARAEMGLGMKA